jgi:hypothetical protein
MRRRERARVLFRKLVDPPCLQSSTGRETGKWPVSFRVQPICTRCAVCARVSLYRKLVRWMRTLRHYIMQMTAHCQSPGDAAIQPSEREDLARGQARLFHACPPASLGYQFFLSQVHRPAARRVQSSKPNPLVQDLFGHSSLCPATMMNKQYAVCCTVHERSPALRVRQSQNPPSPHPSPATRPMHGGQGSAGVLSRLLDHAALTNFTSTWYCTVLYCRLPRSAALKSTHL